MGHGHNDTNYNVTILSTCTRGGGLDGGDGGSSTERIYDGRIKVDTLVDVESESVVRAPQGKSGGSFRQSGVPPGYDSAYQHPGSQPVYARRDS